MSSGHAPIGQIVCFKIGWVRYRKEVDANTVGDVLHPERYLVMGRELALGEKPSKPPSKETGLLVANY